MNINEDVDLMFLTVVFGLFVLFLIGSQTLRYIRLTKYEKKIKELLKNYNCSHEFDYDIMNTFFDFKLPVSEAVNEMLAVKFMGP